MKSRIFKSISTIVLSICLLVVSSIAVQADTTANAGVIDPNAKATLTIHKYYMDEIPESGEATGEENNPSLPEGATPLENVTFIITKVADDSTDPSTATALTGDDAYTETVVTDSNGEAKFTNTDAGLPHGVYLVQEQDSDAIDQKVEDFLVSVPMTNTSGNGWVYDVHIYPKNVLKTVSVDKFVTELSNKHDTAGAADTVTWLATVPMPDDIAGENVSFVLTDELHEATTYTADTVEIYTYDKDGTKITLTAEDDFTVSFTDGSLVVTLTESGRTKLDGAIPDADDDTVPENFEPTFYMTYDTTFTSKFTDHLGTPIAGDLTLDYINNHKVASQVGVTTEPEVHIGGLKIKKVEAGTDTLLSDAKFKIYPTYEDAMAGTNAIMNPSSTTDEWEITTVDGYATFFGLAYGSKGQATTDDPAPQTKYWIVETQAPMYDSDNDGSADKYYNLLQEPVEATVTNTSHTADVVVQNNKGFVLPITGSIGTMLFTVAGVFLIGGGIALYLISRSKKKKAAINVTSK